MGTQRISYYRSLRYDYSACDVDYWQETMFNQQKMEYKAIKNPSKRQVRRKAGIGFFENLIAYMSEDKKKEVVGKKTAIRKKLQEEVDAANAAKIRRCNTHNSRLAERLIQKVKLLNDGNIGEVKEYFTFVLNQDSFRLDGNDYTSEFNIVYDSNNRQLVVDYRLPIMDEISRIKEWKTNKFHELIPKEINKAEYLELYERVLFDISLRVVGLLFESDSGSLLDSIVFNGSCIYNEWQDMPTVILSFKMYKEQYSYEMIRKMDCISKRVISKLKQRNYIGDITSQKPPADLWERPPVKLVVPIKSTLG